MRALFVFVALILLSSTLVFASDGHSYDYKYGLLPLEGREFNDKELSRWIRPIIPAVLDAANTVVATSDFRGVALIISEEEILVATEVFLVSPQVEEVAGRIGVDPTSLHLGAILIWDIIPGGESGSFSAETIPFVDLESIQANNDIGFVRLSRHSSYSRSFSSPEGFSYPIFEGILSPLQNVFVVGHWRTSKPELIMTFTVGTVRLVREDTAQLQVSISPYDWGAPVFVLSDEGSFLLAGLIRWGRLNLQRETEAEMFLFSSLDIPTREGGGN